MMTAADFRSLCAALGFSAFAVMGRRRLKAEQPAAIAISDVIKGLYRPPLDDDTRCANQNYDHLRRDKASKRSAKNASPAPDLASTLPWSCHHRDGQSTIESYDAESGDWQPLLNVPASSHFTAEETANFIARAINDQEKHQKIIRQLTAALEACLDCKGGLDWSAEHDAEIAIKRAKQKI